MAVEQFGGQLGGRSTLGFGGLLEPGGHIGREVNGQHDSVGREWFGHGWLHNLGLLVCRLGLSDSEVRDGRPDWRRALLL
jgi:hypothetical protein